MLGLGKKVTPQDKAKARAQEIIEATRYPLLRAAWGEYRRIKRMDDSYDHMDEGENLYTTPEWFALHKLVEYGGEFTQFSIFDLHLLKSLKEGYLIYDETMHVLMDHHNDTAEAEHLFAAHPSLHKHLPAEFDNTRQVIEVLAEVTRTYRWDMEHFSEEFGALIEQAILKVAREGAKTIEKERERLRKKR